MPRRKEEIFNIAKKTARDPMPETHVAPTDRSLSQNEGASVIGSALRGTEGRKFHIGGGLVDEPPRRMPGGNHKR
jgi:hypothetical protein